MTIYQLKNSIDSLITALLAVYMWYALHWVFALFVVVFAIIPAVVLESWFLEKGWTVPGRFFRQGCFYGLSFFVAYFVELLVDAFKGSAQAGSGISEGAYQQCVVRIGHMEDCSGNIEYLREFANIIMSSATKFNAPFGYECSALSYVFLSHMVAYVLATLIFYGHMKLSER